MTYKEFLYGTYGRLSDINIELKSLIECINNETVGKDIYERFIDVNSDLSNLCKDITKQIIKLELKEGFDETNYNYIKDGIRKEIDKLSDSEKVD